MSCLEKLLLSNNYFLVINTFSDQLLVEDEYLSAQTLLRRSYFFRIGNCLGHVLFGSKQVFQRATFSKKELFSEQTFPYKSHFFLKTSSEWPVWPYSMSWSDIGILQFFIVKNSNEFINSNKVYVTTVTFQEICGYLCILKEALENRPNEVRRICGLKDTTMIFC